MEIGEIRREKLAVTLAVGDVEQSLAEQADKILGYNVRKVKEESEVSEVPKLRAALEKLEIEILNPVDVAKYKMEKRHATEARALQKDPKREPRLFWQDMKISHYHKAIPEFVLNKAIQIKREVPECEIVVDELDENPDPFLIAKIGYHEEYYIEVWSEPSFEGRR